MVELADGEFYHIHRLSDNSKYPNKHSQNWVIGNILSFGSGDVDERNLLCDRVFNPHFNIDWEKSLIRQLSRRIRTAKTLKENKEIQAIFFEKGLLFKYFQLTREIVLEEVRQSLFPDKPSRLNGIWLSDGGNLKTWSKIFPKDKFPQKIFLVKFTGKIHKADARWITNKTLSFERYYKNAMGYWAGLPQSKKGKPDEEYIGNGSIEILSEMV